MDAKYDRRKDDVSIALLKQDIDNMKSSFKESLKSMQDRIDEVEKREDQLTVKLAVYDNTSSIVKWFAGAIVAIIVAVIGKVTFTASLFGGK